MNNSTQQLTTFNFTPGLSIKATVKDGQPWFIAQDISKALGFRDAFNATRILDADELGTHEVSMNTGPLRTFTTVNESGVYSLILRSKKPEAKTFKKWVTATVLPALRKDGIYITGQEKPLPVDLTLPELLAQLQNIQAKVDALKELKVRQWAENNREEREGRTNAFRAMRGKSSIKFPT